MEIYIEKEGVLKFISKIIDSFSITGMSLDFSNIAVNSCFLEKLGKQYFLNQLKPNKIICFIFLFCSFLTSSMMCLPMLVMVS